MKKLLISSILMAAGFLAIVVLYVMLKDIFFKSKIESDIAYSTSQVILGGLGESLRAFFTTWLFRFHNKNKSVLTNAIQFGIVCAAMIGSIWLLIGVEFVDSKDKLSFIIDDGIILFLQGLYSGFILWLIYRKDENLGHGPV